MDKVVVEIGFADCRSDGERLGKIHAFLERAIDRMVEKNRIHGWRRCDICCSRRTPLDRRRMTYVVEYRPSEYSVEDDMELMDTDAED